MVPAVLPPGSRERDRAGRAVFAALAVTVAFGAVTWWTKETPALDRSQPWQDDPYDVIVSLDFVMLPFLVAMIAWRVLLCRRRSALPARRLVDVLRACGVGVGVCIATEVAEWTALALGLHRPLWTASTAWQVAGLAGFTAAGIWVGVLLARAGHGVRLAAHPADQPDWVADLVTFGLLASRRLPRGGKSGRAVVRLVDTQVTSRVRRHPVASAALLACMCALPYTATKILLEGYPPLLVLVSFALPAAALFAFVMVAGRYLRILAPSRARVPAWLPVIVVGCSTGTILFAFHDSTPAWQTPIGLNALLFGGGLAGAGATWLVQLLLPRRRA